MSDPVGAVEAHGTASIAEPAVMGALPDGKNVRLSPGAYAWALFEGVRDPFVILITIYVFMPYFSTVVVGDPVKGQEAVAQYAQWAGWIVMATAPFLGASIDKMGRRKPLLGLTVAAMVPLIAALWFTEPDGSGLSIGAVIVIATVVNVLFAYTEVFHNSMLVQNAGLGGAHKASALALSAGNFFAVSSLIFVLWAFALPGVVDWPFIPEKALFGLNTAAHEQDRIVALISAGMLGIGSIPLFLYAKDSPPTGRRFVPALKEGTRELWEIVTSVRRHRDAAIYLVSRMFYTDGMTALLTFAGVFAAGVMGWQALDMLVYGVSLSVFAVLGGFVGGWLDQAFGPKRAVQIEILMSILGIVGVVGMAPDQILFFWSYDVAGTAPLWGGPFFNTLPEVIYILIGFSNAIFVTAHYASSRTLLTRLTPPEQSGAFFGIYAISGTATLWLGPLLVGLGTSLTKTQQGGFAAISLLLIVGFIGLLFIHTDRPAAPSKA